VENLHFPTMYNLTNANSKLILLYYQIFKSDPPSQQKTDVILILLPQYSDNDIILILLKIK